MKKNSNVKENVIAFLNDNNMEGWKKLTKRVIHSCSKAGSPSCEDLVINNFRDDSRIMEDLEVIIQIAILEKGTNNNMYFDTITINRDGKERKEKVIRFNDNDSIEVELKSGKIKVFSLYPYLCKCVWNFLDKEKDIPSGLVSDSLETLEGDVIEPSNQRYIDALVKLSLEKPFFDKEGDVKTHNSHIKECGNSEINDFLAYVKKNTKPSTYDDISLFVYYLVNGFRINEIAEKMDIPTTKAYDLRKRVYKLYVSYNPINRKTIEFIKVSTTTKKWVTIDNDFIDKACEDVTVTSELYGYYLDNRNKCILVDVPTTTYKRVMSEGVTVKIGTNKKAQSTIYKTIPYTVDSGFTVKNGASTKNIIPVDSDFVTPYKDNTRVKKYVVNMTEKDTSSNGFGCTYYVSRGNNDGFCYGYIGKNYLKNDCNVPISHDSYIKMMDERKARYEESVYRFYHDEKQRFYEKIFSGERFTNISGTTKPTYAKSDKFVFVFDNGNVRKYPIVKK